MIELRSRDEVDAMRPAGRFVAEVLTALEVVTRPGVSLLDLDSLAHSMIRDRGAMSCHIDYHPSFGAMPFGKVLCTSVNDAVLHGLPHEYALRDGDNVTLDFAASVDGWVADSAITVLVGTPRPLDAHMVETAQRALAAGVAKAVMDKDGWTIRSADGSRGVHVEHTVAVTTDGPLVLTARGLQSA